MRLRIRPASLALILLFCVLISPVIAGLDSTRIPQNPNMLSKRVIAEGIRSDDISLYETQGCVVKHTFRDAVSFDCPVEVIPRLKVREARVYHILDINADRQIGADLVWDDGITGAGIDVAVLDTGIDTDHPELSDSYQGGYDCVHLDTVPEDDHGHGTHVAGIITSDGDVLGNSEGVAPGAGIFMYKVCDADGYCLEDDMKCGMVEALKSGAKVMSISIGGISYTTENCDDDPLAVPLNEVAATGMTVVVAAGNDGRGVSTPGCASGAIAVGAVDSADAVPYWSGRGPALDILAPGVNIYSTTMEGGAGTMSGTSMATPHVAGVVALLYDASSALDTAAIREALYSTADPAGTCYQCTFWIGTNCRRQTVVPCTDSIAGAGVVDAFGAYTAVSQPSCVNDADCDNSFWCDGTETCVAGTCKQGAHVVCNDGIDCTSDSCSETADACSYIWPACGVSDNCCGPACSGATDGDCSKTLCWSGSNTYLVKSDTQAMKFCRCAAGTYAFKDYITITAKKATAYKYTDTRDNSIWTVARVSTRNPIQSVECSAGNFFLTNRDYSR